MLTLHTKVEVELPGGDKVTRYLKLKGKKRPRKERGKLITSDPALIKALDNRIAYAGEKTSIICINEEEIPDSQAEKTPRVVETIDGEKRFETDVEPHKVKEPPQVKKKPREVPGVTTVMAAARWLRDNFDDITSRDVSNKGLVTRMAEKKNVVFPDLS